MKITIISMLCTFSSIAFSQNVTVLPNGNMGLITTTPLERFQIGDIWTFHDGGTKFIGRNLYYNGGDKRIEPGYASQIRFDSNGEIALHTSGNGAANSLFTPTTKFKMSTNGNFWLESDATLRFKTQGGVVIGSSTDKIDFWYSAATGHHELYAKKYNKVSDINLKTNIISIAHPLKLIANLEGKEYNLKSNGQKDYGLLAQDVEKILPEIVSESQEFKTIDYNSLIPILIEAIKDQQDQIDKLKSQVEQLQK